MNWEKKGPQTNGTIRTFAWRNRRKLRATSGRISGVPTQVRTRYLSHTSHKHYWVSKLARFKIQICVSSAMHVVMPERRTHSSQDQQIVHCKTPFPSSHLTNTGTTLTLTWWNLAAHRQDKKVTHNFIRKTWGDPGFSRPGTSSCKQCTKHLRF
jgi:hypothetical protein